MRRADFARLLIRATKRVEHLPDRLGLRPDRIPHVNGKDQGAPAGGVVEDDLGGRVGEDPAVPIELAVDADGRKAGGNAPDAMMCLTPSSPSRLSKYRIR